MKNCEEIRSEFSTSLGLISVIVALALVAGFGIFCLIASLFFGL